MALRNQPYIPLYVQDYLTDEKLNMCSLESQGVFIKIMCILHKSSEYGTILLKQKDKQNQSTCLNFAYKFAKLLPIQVDILKVAITELVDEGVLEIDGDVLMQKRMVHDNKISLIRSKVGKKGGKKTQSFLLKQKLKQNTEDEYEYVNEVNIINIEFEKFWNLYDKKVGKVVSIKLWNKLTDEERTLIIDYIPKYKLSREKSKRRDPERFFTRRVWEDEIVDTQKTDNRGISRTHAPISDERKKEYEKL